VTDEWLRRKRRQYAEKLRREWADEMGRDREWWREEAKRTQTDWSSLLRQRIKAMWWVRLGRPPLREFLKLMKRDKT
jgi:hypothetical protein